MSLAKSLPVPIGTTPSAVLARAARRPLATSWTAPSPPTAMRHRAPLCAAARASSVACPGRSVGTISTDHPARRNARASDSRARHAAPCPAAGLRMTVAWSTARSAQVVLVPGDVVLPLAGGARHALRPRGQRRALGAAGAHGVLAGEPPGRLGDPAGALLDHRPLGWWPFHEFEQGCGYRDRLLVHLEGGVQVFDSQDTIPGAAADMEVDVLAQAGVLRRGVRHTPPSGQISFVPGDLELEFAIGATQAAHPGGQRGSLTAAGTHRVALGEIAWGLSRPLRALLDDRPARRWPFDDLEQRRRHDDVAPVHLEHRLQPFDPDHLVPRPAAQPDIDVLTQPGVEAFGHVVATNYGGTAPSVKPRRRAVWRERVGIEPTEALADPSWF